MTEVAVVMAYRDMGDRHRREAFEFTRAWYQRMGFDVCVDAGDSDATFTRASAINRAIRATDAETIVQADPDSLVPYRQLFAAFDAAQSGHGLVVAFTRYCYLTRAATMPYMTRLRQGGGMPLPTPDTWCAEIGRGGVGNVVAFSRETWRLCRGFDERFPLWGGDDAVFAYSAEAMTGVTTRRVEGDMVHLWHPRLPQSVPGHPGYAEQFAILAQYRDAAALGPAVVRALVESRPPID